MDMHDGKAPFAYRINKYGNDSARSKNTLSLEGGPSRC